MYGFCHIAEWTSCSYGLSLVQCMWGLPLKERMRGCRQKRCSVISTTAQWMNHFISWFYVFIWDYKIFHNLTKHSQVDLVTPCGHPTPRPGSLPLINSTTLLNHNTHQLYLSFTHQIYNDVFPYQKFQSCFISPFMIYSHSACYFITEGMFAFVKKQSNLTPERVPFTEEDHEVCRRASAFILNKDCVCVCSPSLPSGATSPLSPRGSLQCLSHCQ